MPSKKWRPFFLKKAGTNIINYKTNFIGEDVIIDTNRPDNITIEEGATITARCIILAHTRNSNNNKPIFHKIKISRNAFIGCNSVICKGVTIGENALVAASSVITKDIPANEVWGGCPARFIKKRNMSIT